LKTYYKFSLLLVLILFSNCSTTSKIAALKPEPDDAAPLVYENSPSIINIPVSIRLKDIENQTNKALTGVIYEDKNIEDDDVQMQISKYAPITIENLNGKIKTVLPLKANIKYRIGTDKFGIALYSVQEINLNGNITLLSDVKLSNWKMNTKTEFKSLDWNETPSIMMLGKSVPITYLINPTIKLFKSKIERAIDDAISNSMDFKSNVLDALDKIATPVQMDEKFNTWLRIVPTELYSTDAKFKNEAINLSMGMKCNMETLIGQKPTAKFDRSKIVLKPVTEIKDEIAANIVAISTYADASALLTKNFSGQEFSSGSKKITVQNVSLWQKNGKMVIALDLLGSINGTIYLTGFPLYNETTKEIYFDKLDYVLDTKSKLLKAANWLAQGVILNKIQSNCKYSIKANLEEGKLSMMKYLKNYSPTPGVFVNGTIGDIMFQKIQLTNSSIVAFIKINGTVNVSVNGLK
jgi:hypothetical protein